MNRRFRALGLALFLTSLAAAGCNDPPHRAVVPTCEHSDETTGQVEAFYRATPVPPDDRVDRQALNETRAKLCRRLVASGIRNAELRVSGQDEIVVTEPRSGRGNAAPNPATARYSLHFYDWEPNVLGDRGPDAPFTGPKALFDAVTVASRSRPRAEAADIPPDAPSSLTRAQADRDNDTSHARLYRFGPDQKLISGPVASREALPGGAPAGSKVLEVPRGIVIVEARRAPNQPKSVQRLFVLEDDSELSDAEVISPRERSDPTGAPVVVFDFTAQGRKRFASLTRRVAERGKAKAAAQRLAIALDDQVVSLASIDFRENPDGIDGRTGAQIEGPMDPRAVARMLRTGPLPVELRLRVAQAR